MSALKRLSSGKFTLEQSFSFEELVAGKVEIISPLQAMADRKIVRLDEKEYKKVKNGMTLANKEKFAECDLVVLEYQNRLVAIYKKDEKGYKAERVWN